MLVSVSTLKAIPMMLTPRKNNLLILDKAHSGIFSSTLHLLIVWIEPYSQSIQKHSNRKGLFPTNQWDKKLHCCHETSFECCATLEESEWNGGDGVHAAKALEWNSLAVTSDKTGRNEGHLVRIHFPLSHYALSAPLDFRLKMDLMKPNATKGWRWSVQRLLRLSFSSPLSLCGWAAHSIFNYHRRTSVRGWRREAGGGTESV